MKTIKTIILFAVCAIAVFAQKNDVNKNEAIAKVGPIKISADEFKQRFELVPQLYGKNKENIEEKKHDLLYSLIAEKLWALEAEDLNLDTTAIMKTTFQAVEKMYVRDALYNNEIKSKVNVSEDELTDAMKKYFEKYNLSVIFTQDSVKGYNIFSSLKNGTSFDSIKAKQIYQIPNVDLRFGEMEPEVENEIYKLNTGDFTVPIKSKSGWLIFKLDSISPLSYTKKDVNESLKKVDEIIRQRKTDKYYNSFVKKFFADKKVSAEGDLFWAVSDKVTHLLSQKKKIESIPDTMDVKLEAADILRMENEFGADTLKMIFIKFKEDPFSVKDFLRYLIFDGFYTKSVDPKIIAAKLNARVSLLIKNELLAKEGLRRGLQNLPDVKESIDMWKENYLAKILKDKFMDSVSVSDEDVYNYYQSLHDTSAQSQVQVNILEILTDSLDVVKKVLDELDNGADFRELAKKYTKRAWTKSKGGEFGFFPVTMYGQLGKKAASMEIGEVYGPIKLSEGYSIFKLIGKKKTENGFTGNFEDSKDKLRQELIFKKLSEFFINHTVMMANKYGVKINENTLSSLNLQNLNMFAIRYMGFGGRITAVPVVLPFTEWYEQWKNKKQIVP